MVHIVGAGPGGVDLITVRGHRLIQQADLIIYAGSLVNQELLSLAKEGAVLRDSAFMTLEEVMEAVEAAEERGLMTVRLHTGDPCLYGAVREQMDWMDEKGISYEICPGVSSFCGAAAALEMEYTLPGITQSVIITRMAGRTPVPERESIRSMASHGAVMVVFLSAGKIRELSEELIAGGYGKDTPAAVVYKATWPEEKVVRCTVGTLPQCGEREKITKTALIVVGESVAQRGYQRSRLYDPAFTTEYREGTGKNRTAGCVMNSRHSTGALSGQKALKSFGACFPEQDAGQSSSPDRGLHKKNAQEDFHRGTMYVVGMGPGSRGQMTGEALETLERCDVIAGYTVYVDLVREYFPDKEFLTTAMTKEEERCRGALKRCMEGKDTAMICSGDSGVYGMAGLALELALEYPGVQVEVIPGVTAANSGAAVLGAPLMHDFAVISLSDRLTPLESIWKRVEAAAEADLVICLYNPASRGRPDYLRQACERVLKWRGEHTVCGLVRNIGREGQEAHLLSLKELRDWKADMFTTVYIGNSRTKNQRGRMVTPRGYRYETGNE